MVKMGTRWGPCTVKDNVNSNLRLIKAQMYVVDYVIVHELAHLFEANHTPRPGRYVLNIRKHKMVFRVKQ